MSLEELEQYVQSNPFDSKILKQLIDDLSENIHPNESKDKESK